LDFEEEDLAAIMVLSPGGEELSFHREDGSWMATDGHTGCVVPMDSLQAILAGLAALDTRDIRVCTEEELLQLGLGQGKALRVRLYSPNSLQDDILIGKTDSLRQQAPLRFWGQMEVFTIPTPLVEQLKRGVSHYCNGPFLDLPAPEELDSVHYRLFPDSIQEKIYATPGGWRRDNGLLSPEDSLRWQHYLAALARIQPGEPAKDFDELQAGRWARRSLVFYARAAASVRVAFQPAALPFFPERFLWPVCHPVRRTGGAAGGWGYKRRSILSSRIAYPSSYSKWYPCSSSVIRPAN
jgi:hypothetical protein